MQGLAEGLGITEPITSPTFALAQHYPQGTPTWCISICIAWNNLHPPMNCFCKRKKKPEPRSVDGRGVAGTAWS